MGNFQSLNKDLKQSIFRNYLNKYDRILLLWALNYKTKLRGSFINDMARYGDLNITKWLYDNDCPTDVFTTSYAALGGQLEILQWLRARNCPWNILVCMHASLGGHLNVLERAIDNGCNYDGWCAVYAHNRGHLGILRWWYEKKIWNRPFESVKGVVILPRRRCARMDNRPRKTSS